jgi:predicted RNase H-like HicB family nuclease
MKPPLFKLALAVKIKKLHIVARKGKDEMRDDVYLAMCLDYDLAAQGDTMEEAYSKIEEQINSYVQAAIQIDNGRHARYLLNRRAPLIYWFWFFMIKCFRSAASTFSQSEAHEIYLCFCPPEKTSACDISFLIQ